MRGRVILQEIESGFYLDASSRWVAGCQEARVFEHTWMALPEGLSHKEKALQVVWCFRAPTQNLYYPVREGAPGRGGCAYSACQIWFAVFTPTQGSGTSSRGTITSYLGWGASSICRTISTWPNR